MTRHRVSYKRKPFSEGLVHLLMNWEQRVISQRPGSSGAGTHLVALLHKLPWDLEVFLKLVRHVKKGMKEEIGV